MEMTAYYGVTRSTYYLEHHGVKGQRWGVRRYQNKDGSLTSAGKRHIQNAVNATADMVKRHLPSPEKRAAAAKARQARKEQKAAEKRQKELDSYKTDPRKRLKNMNQLTNAELKELKERIELENRVTDLTREQLEKPKKMADMVLGYAKTGIDIAKTVADGYDAIQTFKAMANGTRANGKNLVGDELVKFLDAKAKLAGGKSNSDSDNSGSKDSGGKKKDKGSSNSDSDSGSSSDSGTGIYGGKKSDSGNDDSSKSSNGSDSAPANKEYKGDVFDRMADRQNAKALQKEQDRADYKKSKEDYYKQRGDVSGDWKSAERVDNPYNSRKWVENPEYAAKKEAERQQTQQDRANRMAERLKSVHDATESARADRQRAEAEAAAWDERQTGRANRMAERLSAAHAAREAGITAAESTPVKAAMDKPASGSSFTKAASDGKAIVDRYSGVFDQLDNMTSSMLDNNRNKLS